MKSRETLSDEYEGESRQADRMLQGVPKCAVVCGWAETGCRVGVTRYPCRNVTPLSVLVSSQQLTSMSVLRTQGVALRTNKSSSGQTITPWRAEKVATTAARVAKRLTFKDRGQ